MKVGALKAVPALAPLFPVSFAALLFFLLQGFGEHFLLKGVAVGTLGFGSVLIFNPYWRANLDVGMGLLLDNVVRRLGGRGGDPVIQLQTAFGGGKTHTMLAVYHLAQGRVPASELQAVPPILDRAGVVELPKTRVAVIDGIRLSPNQPQLHGTQEVHTLWGELAWQLGGETAYERVRDSDRKGTSPGKKLLADLRAASLVVGDRGPERRVGLAAAVVAQGVDGERPPLGHEAQGEPVGGARRAAAGQGEHEAGVDMDPSTHESPSRSLRPAHRRGLGSAREAAACAAAQAVSRSQR